MTTTTRNAEATPRVEIIDLLTGTAYPETDHDAVRRMMGQAGLVICETAAPAPGRPPRRTFRTPERHCGDAPPEAVPIRPVGIHVRRTGEPDVRFAPDMPPDDQDAYDYAGWLPLSLIRHPDGQGPHQAWATGDDWIREDPAGTRDVRSGIQACAIEAKRCLAEALLRRHACWWSGPEPSSWPLDEAERHKRMRLQAEELCRAGHTLCYDLKVNERRAQAGKRNGLPMPIDEDAAALHRIARIVSATGVLVPSSDHGTGGESAAADAHLLGQR